MISVPLSRPFNTEINYEVAVINSLEDPLQQGRVRISTATMSGVDPSKLPWSKAVTNHSQVSSDQGGTIESPHSFKLGDMVLVYRPTASDQDWQFFGHPGTITGSGSGSTTGPQNFYWNSDVRTGSTQSAKPKITKTTYPQDGEPTWLQPAQIQIQQAQQPDVRQYYNKKAGDYDKPALYQPDIWGGQDGSSGGQNITNSPSVGSPVTQVIQQEDQTFKLEAQKNNQALQMLHRLRVELNTSDFNQFLPKANNGLVQTIQGLLSGGGGGMSGVSSIVGMAENLLSAFNTMGQQSIQTGVAQNQAMANGNQFLDATGTVLPTVVSITT